MLSLDEVSILYHRDIHFRPGDSLQHLQFMAFEVEAKEIQLSPVGGE